MPTLRGRVYYVKRRFRGIGPVYRSLGTKRKGRAVQLETMLVTLHDGGRSDLVRAFADGVLRVQEIAEYYESGRTHELVERLKGPPRISLKKACDAALKDKAPDIKGSTLQRYTEGLQHLQRVLGEVDLQDALTKDEIQRYKAVRLEEGAARETINNELIAVGILSTYALERGWIRKRPAIKKYRYETRMSYLDPDQLTQYMALIRRPFRVQMQVLVGTGMRLGESEGLTVGDIRNDRALVVDAKSRERRPVHLPLWVLEALQQHIEDKGFSSGDALFTIGRRTVQREHDRACHLAGIMGYTVHDHRHTFAVALARAGLPLPVLQRQLGHKTITTTMKYAEFHPAYNDAAVYFERVAESFGLAGSGNKAGNISPPMIPGVSDA